MLEWLDQYNGVDGNAAWRNFVESNYLKGSFVDQKYNVVEYNGTLKQLSQIIYNRSVIMIEKYEEQLRVLCRNK